jgi:hypothetical protein
LKPGDERFRRWHVQMRVRNRRVLGVVGGVHLWRRRGEVSAGGGVRRVQGLRRRRRRVDGRGGGRRGRGHRGAEGEVGAEVRAARARGAGETEVKVQIHPPAAPRGLIGFHPTASRALEPYPSLPDRAAALPCRLTGAAVCRKQTLSWRADAAPEPRSWAEDPSHALAGD